MKILFVLVVVVLIGSFVGWGNIFEKSASFIEENKESIEKGANFVDESSRKIVKKIQESTSEKPDSSELEVEDAEISDEPKIQNAPDTDTVPEDATLKKPINKSNKAKK